MLAMLSSLIISLLGLPILFGLAVTSGFSGTDKPHDNSRRDLLWKVPVGTAFVYGYGNLAYKTFAVQHLKYPDAHERRVISTIAESLKLASESNSDRPALRVLEVGIGKDLRLLRAGLYAKALEQIAIKESALEITGVDIDLPRKEIVEATNKLLKGSRPHVTISTTEASITSRMPFRESFFDVVICSLTLCSVDSQEKAIAEMNRVLRSDGTLGYIEHVAVNPDEPYRFLKWQQQAFDPLQQALADNCHLHRFTEDAILAGFGPNSRLISKERFLVDDMWPVSCQACGILQKG